MINWKVRFKNKVWVVGLVTWAVTAVYDLLTVLGVTPRVDQASVMDFLTAGLHILVLLGIIVDPTTANLGDSKRALDYEVPWKDE